MASILCWHEIINNNVSGDTAWKRYRKNKMIYWFQLQCDHVGRSQTRVRCVSVVALIGWPQRKQINRKKGNQSGLPDLWSAAWWWVSSGPSLVGFRPPFPGLATRGRGSGVGGVTYGFRGRGGMRVVSVPERKELSLRNYNESFMLGKTATKPIFSFIDL